MCAWFVYSINDVGALAVRCWMWAGVGAVLLSFNRVTRAPQTHTHSYLCTNIPKRLCHFFFNLYAYVQYIQIHTYMRTISERIITIIVDNLLLPFHESNELPREKQMLCVLEPFRKVLPRQFCSGIGAFSNIGTSKMKRRFQKVGWLA